MTSIRTRTATFVIACFALSMATAARGLRAQEVREDGALRLTIPDAGASHQNPAFSPGGERLVLTSFDNGYNEGPAALLVLELVAGDLYRITPIEDQDNVNLPGSAWNVDSGRIVLSSDRHEADDLWQIAADGGHFERLTTHSDATWFIEPSWSPNGAWVVFERSRPGASEDGRVSEIWKVEVSSGELVQVTGSDDHDDRQPNWSPRGDRILFQRRSLPDGDWDVMCIGPDGGEIHNITADPQSCDTDASFSPSGTWIVYSRAADDDPVPGIYIKAVTWGQPPIRITCAAGIHDSAPSWSPDGRCVAFEAHPDEDAAASLWLMELSETTCSTVDLHPPPRRTSGRLRP